MAEASPGIRKSAILLLCLDRRQAQQILSRLPSDAVEAVRQEMHLLEDVPAAERSAVFEEYRRELSQPVECAAADPLPECSPDGIFEALRDEHPQVISALLASLPVEKAGQCLARLPIRGQIEVIRRLASLQPIEPKLMDEIFGAIRSQARHDPPRQMEVALLAQVLEDADELPDALETSRFVFEDLLELDDDAMRLVLEEMDSEGLALAISTASHRLRRRVLSVLSATMSHSVKAAAQSARPVYLSDIESAQAKILRVVQRLEAAGELSLETQNPGVL